MSPPDEAEVHAQRAVDPRAVDAQEHAVRDARPARVLGRTIKAHLLEGGNTGIRGGGVGLQPRAEVGPGGGDASASSLKHLHVFTLRLTDGKKISKFTFELAPTPMKGRGQLTGQLTGHLRQVRHPA